MHALFLKLMGTAAYAVEFDPEGILQEGSGLSTQDPVLTTINIIEIVLGIIGLIFLILVIVGGVMIMTSGGSKERVKKGRNFIIAAVVGLALVLASWGISEYVFSTLVDVTSGTGTTAPSAPPENGPPEGGL